jgi:hypothetical protein
MSSDKHLQYGAQPRPGGHRRPFKPKPGMKKDDDELHLTE